MVLAVPALPYGMRDIKITPFTTAAATTLGSPVDLPNARTLSFSEAEEFTELRGDDRVVAIHGNGAVVDWDLEAGGISLEAWAVLTGGTLTTTGVSPAEIKKLTKSVQQSRPYFQITGKAISDSGGHVLVTIHKAKCNDTIEGSFTDGEFYLTSGSGQGVPSTVTATVDLLYTFEHFETADLTT